jgi:hypothetical protein
MAISNLVVTPEQNTESIKPIGFAKIVFDADDNYPTGGYAIAIPLASPLQGFQILLAVGEPQGSYRFDFDPATQKCRVLVADASAAVTEVAATTDLDALDDITLRCLVG